MAVDIFFDMNFKWGEVLISDCKSNNFPPDEVQEAMKDMDGEREDYKDNLEQLKDFLENQKTDMDDLKSQVRS